MSKLRAGVIGLEHYHVTGWVDSLGLFRDQTRDRRPLRSRSGTRRSARAHLLRSAPQRETGRGVPERAVLHGPRCAARRAEDRPRAGDAAERPTSRTRSCGWPGRACTCWSTNRRADRRRSRTRVSGGAGGRGESRDRAGPALRPRLAGCAGDDPRGPARANSSPRRRSSPPRRSGSGTRSNLIFDRELSGGGILHWLGVHDIDQLLWQTGDQIVEVQAMTANVGGRGDRGRGRDLGRAALRQRRARHDPLRLRPAQDGLRWLPGVPRPQRLDQARAGRDPHMARRRHPSRSGHEPGNGLHEPHGARLRRDRRRRDRRLVACDRGGSRPARDRGRCHPGVARDRRLLRGGAHRATGAVAVTFG